MFDQLRASLRGVFDPERSPADRRAAASAMKEALVAARIGLDDLRHGVVEARARVEAARTELETIRRRGRLAAGVGDQETVVVAERFAATQAERVAVLEAKADAQARELALAERELAEMTAEFRRMAATGRPDVPPGVSESDASAGAPGAATPDADAMLAALKRRMGR